MSHIVADTHALIWYLAASPKLSAPAQAAISATVAAGNRVLVSAISLVEITYLVEKRRIPVAAQTTLIRALETGQSEIAVVPLNFEIACTVTSIPRNVVPDMPNRTIADTARHFNLPVVTRDARLALCGVQTIW